MIVDPNLEEEIEKVFKELGTLESSRVVNLLRMKYPDIPSLDIRKCIRYPKYVLTDAGWQRNFLFNGNNYEQ